MKRMLGLIAILALLTLSGCDLLFPPEDTGPDPTGPTLSGAITNSGAGGITSVKVGVFQNRPAIEGLYYTSDAAGGKITAVAALAPKANGTITGSAYTVTYPVLDSLPINKDLSGNEFTLVAWNDANTDGKLDTTEYNTMATVAANEVDGVTAAAYLTSAAYSNRSEVWDYYFSFKYTDADTIVAKLPSEITDKTVFDFNMNF